MAKEMTITCRMCGSTSVGKIKIASLGLRKYTCPTCNHKHSLPMTRTRRIAYWVLVAVIVAASVVFKTPVGWLLMLLLLGALYMDYSVKDNIKCLAMSEGDTKTG